MTPGRQTPGVHQVSVGGRIVAHIFNRDDYAWLEWQNGYWNDPERPVLGLAFEDRPNARIASSLSLPPWFSNLLPEGRLREWVAGDAGVSPDRELLLLSRLGGDLPGAVVIAAADGDIDPTWRPQNVTLPQVASADEVTSLQRPRFSLAGVALKFSLVRRGERLTIPARDEDGDWIVKMPDSVYEHVPHNEFAMMSMAKLTGINVPELRMIHRDQLTDLPSNIWPRDQEWAYAIRRFDRTNSGRIHIEDLAQVRGFYPRDKYRGSFETVAALVYRRRDLSSYLEFIRRLFFSYAIGNGDMHLKNVSLVYPDGRRPVIAPAYDLVSTAPYLGSGPEEDLGLKLHDSRRFNDVLPGTFESLARQVGAPIADTREVVREVAGLLGDAWTQVRPHMELLPAHCQYLDQRVRQVQSIHR